MIKMAENPASDDALDAAGLTKTGADLIAEDEKNTLVCGNLRDGTEILRCNRCEWMENVGHLSRARCRPFCPQCPSQPVTAQQQADGIRAAAKWWHDK